MKLRTEYYAKPHKIKLIFPFVINKLYDRHSKTTPIPVFISLTFHPIWSASTGGCGFEYLFWVFSWHCFFDINCTLRKTLLKK